MSTDQEPIGEAREPTEEELRAAYEEQVKRLRVEHVVLETVVTLANLGMRRTGLAPGTEDERDPEQVRMAVDSIRALMPVVETAAPQQAAAIRDALSQLQLAFVRIGGQETGAPSGGSSEGGPAPGGGAGPGQAGPGDGGSGGPGGAGPGQGGPGPAGPDPGAPAPGAKRDEPGPAQRSGRLWVPGQ
ncbi:MAG: hypothetical protein JO244_07500 [Solirubrobacterales bacterium]|nr:hypothetical protein [Solirubrobacterales bacterium]